MARQSARTVAVPETPIADVIADVRRVGRAVRALWRVSVGAQWAKGFPVWFTVAAFLAPSWFLWSTFTLAFGTRPWIRARAGRKARVISDREAYVLAAAAGAVTVWWAVPHPTATVRWATRREGHDWQYALWRVLHPALTITDPAWTVVPFLALLAAVGGWWWWTRFLRRPPKIVRNWDTYVAGRDPRLAGTTITAPDVKEHKDGPEGTAILEIPAGAKRSEIATLDEVAESLLADAYPGMHRGAVTLSAVPSMGIREVKVVLSRRGDEGRNRDWEGPTLDAEFRFIMGTFGSARPRAQFINADGAQNFACVAAPSKGKSTATRLILVEAALSPKIGVLGICGKRGSGIGYMAPGTMFMARTEEQWLATFDAAMAILKLRETRYGDNGWASFDPRRDPMLYVHADEWKWILKRWPRLASSAVEFTGKGRALGCGLGVNLQKGDGEGYGAIELRNNVYGNGTAWLGPSGDTAAQNVAKQDYDVDLSSLPGEPGWAYLGSSAGAAKMRTLWVPNQEDRDRGKPAPFGVVEEWLTGTVNPLFHLAEQAILDDLASRTWGDTAQDTTVDAAAAVRPVSDPSKRDEVYALIKTATSGGLMPGQIVATLGGSRQHVQDILADLRDEGKIHQPAGERTPWVATSQEAAA